MANQQSRGWLHTGLLKPNIGDVWLKGELVTSPREIVGMAFQNPVLLEWRSILKNVMLPLEIVPNSLGLAAKEQRALDLLRLVGLAGFEDKKALGVIWRYASKERHYAVHWFISRNINA